MRQILLFLILVVVASGCRTSLKSNWQDFNAYYNTFYNAKKSYNLGLEKNLGQQREYNPLQPIRIHERPVNAGAEDFNKAIEKGADILRNHNDTRWVDDALELIGKSYYFRQEYYSADQKFQELFTTTDNPKMKQEAIIWQGRVLLDMGLYNQGISYLNEELISFENWDKKKRAEAQALLAQHYVNVENWSQAKEQLLMAIPDLPEKKYKERAFFMLGQINERMGDQQAAFEAYDRVQDFYTEYRLQYLAKRKKAEVARNLDRNSVAYSIFDDMVRDDKNTEYRTELDYELARTEQRRGNFEKAEEIYLRILRGRQNQPSPETSARAYNSLAEIYRFQYDDLQLASAYYDSAARMNADPERLPEDFRAAELAESFGEYTRIQNEISLQDSLLMLGQLSPQEFDSAMVELRLQKRRELERLREEQEARENQLVNVSQGENNPNAANRPGSNRSNGFLNIRNQSMVADARAQFRAIWGDRPLADNWRVAELIESASSTNDNPGIGDGEVSTTGESGIMEIRIDISNVPFTEQAQDSVRRLISEYQYELGNLFFISLNMPDSASKYYKKAINNPATDEVNTVSLYSLSELESIAGNSTEARNYARRLVNEYPKSVYARRLAGQYDLDLVIEEDSAQVDTIRVYNRISEIDSLTATERAEMYRDFAENYTSSVTASQAMYDAIYIYMQKGKEDSLYTEKVNNRATLNDRWEARQDSFQVLRDSLSSALTDTTLTLPDSVRTNYEQIMDSTLTKPDLYEFFPYQGVYWDSARVTIDDFLRLFSNSELNNRVKVLEEELKLPDSGRPAEEPLLPEPDEGTITGTDSVAVAPDSLSASPSEDQEPIPSSPDSTIADAEPEQEEIREGYVDCSELNTELSIRGGKDQILQTVRLQAGQLPDSVAVDSVVYRFYVNQRGVVDDFTLKTENIPDKLKSAFSETFRGLLSFEPVLRGGSAVSVQCDVSFDITSNGRKE